MMESFSFKFYLNKTKKQGDKYKIYGRLIVNRKKAEFSTPHYIEENKWDTAKGRAKSNTVNDDLLEIENKIRAIRRRLIDNNKTVSSNALVQYYKNKKTFDHYLIPYFEKFIQNMKEKNEVVQKTIQSYGTTLKSIIQFLELSYKSKNILINEIDFTFIKGYDHFMVTEYTDNYENKIVRNTINKHHTRFRTILHNAIKEDIIIKNPYINLPLKKTKTHRSYLTLVEINLIKDHDFGGNISLQRVRDFFLFSVYTGLRYQDAYNLKMDDIKTDNDGNRIIQILMEKTDDKVDVPLLDEAKIIVERYESDAAREVYGYVLPRYSNQKINTYLKVIADLCGITKTITHHVGRHSFATLALNKKVPIEVVQKVLGHTDVKTTQIYAKMMTQTVVSEMQKMNEAFK
ncbi:MAG: site-specific integrase [Salinivirgaceae bacterium]|nr:site-specific integrase [Salinivirgaceae bacterium]